MPIPILGNIRVEFLSDAYPQEIAMYIYEKGNPNGVQGDPTDEWFGVGLA